MSKKTSKPAAPYVDTRTPEQKAAQKQEFILRRLTMEVERAQAIAKELAEKFAKSLGDAEYQLRWMQGTYKAIRMGQFAEEALRDGLDGVLVALKSKLGYWSPENSTSPHSNACNNEDYEAMKDFLQRFEELNREEA